MWLGQFSSVNSLLNSFTFRIFMKMQPEFLVKLFYSTLIALSLSRFVAFVISASLLSSNAYFYKYLLSAQSLTEDDLN